MGKARRQGGEGGRGEDEVEVTDEEESREDAEPIPSDLRVPRGGSSQTSKINFKDCVPRVTLQPKRLHVTDLS